MGAALSPVDGIHPDTLLSCESTGRVIATMAEPEVLPALAEEKNVSGRRIGEKGGVGLRIGPPREDPGIDALAAPWRALWEQRIPRRWEVS